MHEKRRAGGHRAALAAVAAGALAMLAPQHIQAQTAKTTVTVVLKEEPEGLDGCNANRSTLGPIVKENIFETLTSIDAKDGTVVPRLALSWQQVDPTTWRFKLRESVSFHDGLPFDAEAAVFSIHRTMGTELNCETRYRQLGDVKMTAKAIDKYTLEITTKTPEPILPVRMAVLAFVSPKTAMDSVTLQPVGTGPYVFDHYTPGQEVVIKRNEKYWGGKPAVEIGRFVWRSESAVRAAMVAVGEADIANNISQEDANNPATDVSYLNAETLRQRIDATRPPLDDKRIRLALNYAVDRNALRGTVLSKDVIPATQIVGPSVAGHNHDLDKVARGYDPAKARQLVAEAKAAGTPVDKEILVVGRPNQYPGANESVEALAAMYRAVGLNVRVRNLEVAEWLDMGRKPFAENRGAVLRDELHDNRMEPVFSMFNKYACDGLQSTLCNPETDKLISKASTSSGQERIKAWQDVFRNIYEDNVSEVWLFHMVAYARVAPRIRFVPNIKTNGEIPLAEIAFR